MTPLQVAQSQLGVIERGGPDGRSGNVVPYWDWWDAETGEHDQGASWCGAFVSWCFEQSDQLFVIAGKPGFIYCPAGERWFQSQGLIVQPAYAKPDDIAFFHFPGEADEANHTGVVESVDGPHRTITCIEGNTTEGMTGHQSNGGGVYRRTRSWMLVHAIGHTAWVHGIKEERVNTTTVHATPEGVVATFTGFDGHTTVNVDPSRFQGVRSASPAWSLPGIDGRSIVVYANPATDVVVTFT